MLARFAGAVPRPQAEAAEQLLRAEGLATEIVDEDEPLWDEQRAAQRGPLVVKVSGLPTGIANLARAADETGGSVVGRAALGLSWVRFEEPSAEAVERLRRDSWPWCRIARRIWTWTRRSDRPGVSELMRRVKERFDPAGVCV